MKRAILAATLVAVAAVAIAADHAEAPLVQADPAADLGDLYAWVDSGNLVLILTFAPLSETATYDDETILGIHVDYNDDQTADENLWFRFGQNGSGDWGVQVELESSSDGSLFIDGPVETVNEEAGYSFWAGNADDPFFFDLQGFSDSLSTGTIAFTATDGLAGTNTSAVVFESPAPTADSMRVWATSGRL